MDTHTAPQNETNETQVSTELNHLSTALGNVEELFERLEVRLRVVSTPPQENAGVVVEGERPLLCDIAAVIRTHTDTVERIHECINSALARLEV